jgi:hypothetical protein
MDNTPISKKENRKYTKSLGLYSLPERTFEHDLAISDRYQQFSAELLRLALLGITAIAFLITNILLRAVPDGDQAVEPILPLHNEFKLFIIASLICLGISVALALLHRYVSSDSMATHLELLRRELRQAQDDATKAEKERETRNKRFKWSFWLLIASGFFLWFGAMALIASLSIAIL